MWKSAKAIFAVEFWEKVRKNDINASPSLMQTWNRRKCFQTCSVVILFSLAKIIK